MLSEVNIGITTAFSISENKNVRVSCEEYNKYIGILYLKTDRDESYLKGINKDKVSAFDLHERTFVKVTKAEFDELRNIRYVGVRSPLVKQLALTKSGNDMI